MTAWRRARQAAIVVVEPLDHRPRREIHDEEVLATVLTDGKPRRGHSRPPLLAKPVAAIESVGERHPRPALEHAVVRLGRAPLSVVHDVEVAQLGRERTTERRLDLRDQVRRGGRTERRVRASVVRPRSTRTDARRFDPSRVARGQAFFAARLFWRTLCLRPYVK